MKNLFDKIDLQTTIDRINKLTPESKRQWGKMNVSQMLAHVNVAYDMAHTDKYPKSGTFKTFMLKLFVKNAVVGQKPYPKNARTAPEFVIANERDFKAEKKILVDYLHQTQSLGAAYFEGKQSNSFGPLTTQEWNTLFSKHLDHHLTQFGV